MADGESPRWEGGVAEGGERQLFDGLMARRRPVPVGSAFVIEAALPLEALGLQPRGGLALQLEWNILSPPDGRQVKDRLYWANKTATGVSDEAVGARLEPALWGTLRFAGSVDALLGL